MSAFSTYVYEGFWTNWSQGRVLGSTLTLSSQHAGYLSSALGVFVTLVGSQAWVILSYLIHQIHAQESSDGLGRQQQIILRNSGSAAGAAWQLICLPFAWRHSGPRSRNVFPPLRYLGRCFLLLLPALFTFIVFSVAGVLSSQINKAAGNEVLLSADFCGQWNFVNTTSENFSNKLINETLVAANYARYCYGGPSTVSSLCGTYRQQQILWSVNQNASCPFQSGICQFSNSAALQLDTGYMDSHHTLGLNAAPKDRVNFRRLTTCAPLSVQGRFTSKTVVSAGYYDYSFGNYLGPGNITLEFAQMLADSSVGYQLLQYTSRDGSWTVTPEMARSDADITLFALATNGVGYYTPVYDPFFAATSWNMAGDSKYYVPDGPNEYVHFVGCTDQYQLCSATDETLCTPLTAQTPLIAAAESMTWLTSKQKATVDRIILSLRYGQIHYSTFGRDSAALLAKEKLIQVISSSLPNNQWMIEVQEWFAVALARMQHSLVEFVTGPAAVFLDGMSFITLNGTDSKALCQAQIVRIPGEHQSFSVFGLAFTLTTGILLILLSLTIESIGSFVLTKCTEDRKHKRIQWLLDGKLQLLRMAEEYADKGTWIRTAEDVPIPVEKEKIFRLPGDLNLENPGLRSSQGPSQPYMDEEETQNRATVVPIALKNDYGRGSTAAYMRGGGQMGEVAQEREWRKERSSVPRKGQRAAGYELVDVDEIRQNWSRQNQQIRYQ